jgi:CO dehydrogenase nickel-insertion accessory protein CooC1
LTTRAYPPTFCAVGVVFVGTGGSGKPTMAGVSCAQVVTRAEGVARIDAGTTPGLNQVLGMDHRPSGRCRAAG